MVGVHVDMMWWNLRTHKPVLVLHPVRPVLMHTVHIVVLHPVRPVLLHTVPTVPIVVLHPVPIVVLHSVPTMLLHPVPTVMWHPMPTMLLHAVTTVLLHPVPAMVSIFMPSLPSITHLSVVVRLRQRRWGHEVHMGFLLVMRQHSSVVATASLNELIIV